MSTTAERLSNLKSELSRMSKAAETSGKYNWKFLAKPTNGGHRYFIDLNSGRLAVADNSGKFPDWTDDGVLWVDSSRPVRVEVSRSGYAAGDVPVIDENGRKSMVPGTAADAKWLRSAQRMRVEFGPKAQLIRDI